MHSRPGPATSPRRRIVARLLLALVLAPTGVSGVGPSPAHAAADGQITVRLVDAPVERQDDPRAQVYVVDHVAPGTSFTRHVEVTNATDLTRSFSFYAGPSRIDGDAWLPDDPGAESELTDWVTVGENAFVLAPGESHVVPATFDVPVDASEGERYGVLWASTESTGSTGGHGVAMVSRVGVRVYLSVGPGGEPATSFELGDLRTTRTGTGKPRVVATVTNTGGRAIDLKGELTLSDGPGGLAAGPFPIEDSPTVAPGATGRLVATLDRRIPQGPWRITLTAWSGRTERRVSDTTTFSRTGARPDEQVTSTDSVRWTGHRAGLTALPVAVLAAGLLLRARRRTSRRLNR